MPNPFNVDKTDLLERVLERYGAQYNRTRNGWQKLSCINEAAHMHGDRNPSASVHLIEGKYRCFGCDIYGDGFDLMLLLEGVKADEVLAALEMKPGKVESDWLF